MRNHQIGYVYRLYFGLLTGGGASSTIAHGDWCCFWAGGPGMCKEAPEQAMESKRCEENSSMGFASVPAFRFVSGVPALVSLDDEI